MLDGKVCLVTGAGDGIGRATAIEMGQQKAGAVVVADIDETKGLETVRLVRETGADALFVRIDARVAADLRSMVEATVSEYGGLDVLHNNVGVLEASLTEQLGVENLPEDVWDVVYEVNLRSYFLATKYAAPHLRRSTRGPAIVNTASVSGLVAYPGGPAYAATKGGVIMLTKVTAVDLAPTVRCNCFCPAATETAMMRTFLDTAATPAEREQRVQMMTATHLVQRAGRPEEIGKLACFLASDESSFINGAAYVIDGGSLAWRGAYA